MRTMLIIAGLLFCVAMVVFGKNPVQKAREERAKQEACADTEDAVACAIEHYNAEKSKHTGMLNSSITSPVNTPYNDQYQNGSMVHSNQNQQLGIPQANQNPPPDTYYPPAPPPTHAPGLSPQSYKTPLKSKGIVLGSGQRVNFMGAKVYTVNGEGKTVPMPNGKYPLFNGNVTLIVHNGTKMMTFGPVAQ